MSKFLTLMNPNRRRRRSSRRRLFGAALAAHQRKAGRRTHRRVRRNPAVAVRRRPSRRRRSGPPAMTPAMRAKISRAVKASIRARASRPRALAIFRRRPVAARKASRRRFSRSLGSFTGSIRSAFSKDLVLKAGGAVVASFGTGYLLQKYGGSLPLANNKYGRILYSVGIPVALAFLVRKKSRPLAEGMVIGGLVMGINALISQVKPAGVAGVSGMVPIRDMGVAGELGFSYYPPAPRSIGAPLNTGAFSNSPW